MELFLVSSALLANPLTDWPASPLSSLHAYADDVLAILDELGVERCIYVGHSVSSMIGFLASIERPSVFEKIVCFSASPRWGTLRLV